MSAHVPTAKPSIRQIIAHEMRGAVMMLPREQTPKPGPYDLDAEQFVLCELLNERVTSAALKPLQSKHFYGLFAATLFEVLNGTDERELTAVASLMDLRGPVIEELEIIRDATLFAKPNELARHVRTVMDRWLERELIRVMQRVDVELRAGALTHDGARARLRQHFLENAG